MKKETKVFAFKLAQATEKKDAKWKARDGVAVAGCSLAELYPGFYDYRCRTYNGDFGPWC